MDGQKSAYLTLALETSSGKSMAASALFSPMSTTRGLSDTQSPASRSAAASVLSPLRPMRTVGLAGGVIEVRCCCRRHHRVCPVAVWLLDHDVMGKVVFVVCSRLLRIARTRLWSPRRPSTRLCTRRY